MLVSLILALIMLLVITVLGVSSVRMSNLDTQMSGNSMYSSMVFQGAESALVRAKSDLYNVVEAAQDRTQTFDVPTDPYFLGAEEVTSGVTLESSASIKFKGKLNEPPRNSVANDTTFQYQVFQISGSSSLVATSARDAHTEGVAVQIAP